MILPCRGRTTHPAPQGSGWIQEALNTLQRAAGTTGAPNRAEPRALHGVPRHGAWSASSGHHLGLEDPRGFVLLSCSLIHSFICLFIHSLMHSFTHSLIYAFTHSFIHSLTHTFIHSLVHSFTHSFIQSLIHSLTHSINSQTPLSPNTMQPDLTPGRWVPWGAQDANPAGHPSRPKGAGAREAL